MAFTPNSTVYLCDTPLDNLQKNQLRFTTASAQYNYFYAQRKHTFDDVTYSRKDNTMKVNKNIDLMWDVNYVMYRNENFTQKWFYAFIIDMKFVSDNVTEITIETDVFQTWFFDVTLKNSFVLREHVTNDTIGLHLVDEQLEFGDYTMEDYSALGVMGANWNIIAVSDNSPLGNDEQIGNRYGNLVSGLTYFPFPNTTSGINWLKTFINAFTEKPDAIVMIFTVPHLIIRATVDDPDWVLGAPISSGDPYGFDYISIPKHLADVDGYVPQNNKLRAFPYKFLYVSNNVGQSANYRYEDFEASEMDFMAFGSVMPNPSVMLAPNNYKGDVLSYEHGLTLSGFPLGSWTTDTYNAWFAQNAGQVGIALVGSAVGIASGNPVGMIGGALGIASQMSQVYKAMIQPDQAKGQIGGGSLMYGVNALDFFTAHMTIKSQYAKQIDDYLSMFGYKINALKVPEIKSRLYWNYVQTIDINIDGAIPFVDMKKLKDIYNGGVTIWHNPSNFCRYDLDNGIGDLWANVPNPVSATTNLLGTVITLVFSEAMREVGDKISQFTVKVNSVTRGIVSGDTVTPATNCNFLLTTPVGNGDVVSISYTKGSFTSADGGVVNSFSNFPVTNATAVPPTLVGAQISNV